MKNLHYNSRVPTAVQMPAQVAIRVRPPLLRELEGYQPFQNTALVDPSEKILTVSENWQSIQNGGNAGDVGLVRGTPSM